MDSSSRRRALLGDGDHDGLEEGEYVPGHYHHSSSDSDADDIEADDGEVVPQHGGGRMHRLDDIIAVGGRVGAPLPPASPTTPSSESEGTISDESSAGGGGARPARKFACHVCDKGFSSRKAVDGHMRVHASGGGSGARLVAQAAPPAPFSGGWAATGRRGCTGGKAKTTSASAAASLSSDATTGHSTAIVAVQQVMPPLEPVPMAFAVTTNLSPMPSSTRTNLSASGEGDEGSSATATATAQPTHYTEPVAAAAAAVVTGANPSSTGAGARAAGLVNDQLAVADQQAPGPQVHRQAVSSVPPPPAQQAHFAQQPLVPPPPPAAAAGVQLQQGGQLVVPRPALPPREYSCKECGKTYSTHQGLGGHAAGHKNRQREQEAMAAAAGMMMMPNGGGGGDYLAALRRGGRKADQPHTCQKCNKVFATGVALGGHMRMHYTGPPIVHKSKKRIHSTGPPPPAISEADLRLALSNINTQEPSSSTAPAAVAGTGRLRLFGIDIGPLVQQLPPPPEQQGSGSGSGTTEGGSSSAGEQQHK